MTVRLSRWHLIVGVTLVALSGVLYLVHYSLFRDAHHIVLYLVGDLAFVPINTLIVTMFIEQLLVRREKRLKLKKLNMVIGAFFSNAGVDLLRSVSGTDAGVERIRKDLLVDSGWTGREFEGVIARIKKYDFKPLPGRDRLGDLRDFLADRRDFLLRLLENPNLLEHDTFADLLWAVFHLAEELSCRDDFNLIPESDYNHLAGDIKRAYGYLVTEWLEYMRHLKSDYPYLFSLALRTNPFDPEASPLVL
jgi:hypothetical protein